MKVSFASQICWTMILKRKRSFVFCWYVFGYVYSNFVSPLGKMLFICAVVLVCMKWFLFFKRLKVIKKAKIPTCFVSLKNAVAFGMRIYLQESSKLNISTRNSFRKIEFLCCLWLTKQGYFKKLKSGFFWHSNSPRWTAEKPENVRLEIRNISLTEKY